MGTLKFEQDWIAEFRDLLRQFDDIPIASEQFVIFVGYLKVLFRKYLADQKYNGG